MVQSRDGGGGGGGAGVLHCWCGLLGRLWMLRSQANVRAIQFARMAFPSNVTLRETPNSLARDLFSIIFFFILFLLSFTSNFVLPLADAFLSLVFA